MQIFFSKKSRKIFQNYLIRFSGKILNVLIFFKKKFPEDPGIIFQKFFITSKKSGQKFSKVFPKKKSGPHERPGYCNSPHSHLKPPPGYLPE
jgi:hypothetical protein